MYKNSKHAFTLAEVLLTLVIVGIISGLVLPSLLKDMQAKSRMGILKATLIGIDDSINKEIAQKRSDDIINLDIYNNPQLFLNKFNNAVSGVAFAKQYKNYNGEVVNTVILPESSILLKNGAGIGLVNPDITDTDKRYTVVAIDVTGEKAPNVVGRDYFLAKLLWDEGKLDEENEDKKKHNGIHVGDVHGFMCGKMDETTCTEETESVSDLKSDCLGGNAAACFRLAELTGFDSEYVEDNY